MPWTAKTTYDTFSGIGEDISAIVTNLSPDETPFLDLLPEPPRAATSTAHQWSEELLGPDTLIASTAVNSATAATGIQINGFGNQLQVGMILEIQADEAGVANELVQITSVPGANSILVARNHGAAGVSSLVAGGTIVVISTAELEGSTSSGDVHRPPTRRTNYMQIFKKVITITGTDRAVSYVPDMGDEFDHQVVLRTRELMRDVEKAVFRGRLSGNSIGSGTAYRTMGGLREFITSINSVIVDSSFTADPVAYTNNLLQQAYNVGARDIDLIVVGSQWKRALSAFASTSRIVSTEQTDTKIIQLKEYLQTDFGSARLLLSPWMPPKAMYGIATARTFVTPLRGRTFQFERIAKTGDSDVGHVIGEYTLEIHRPDAMFRASA